MQAPKKPQHFVICVPGLGNETWIFRLATKNWERDFGLTPIIVPVYWKIRERGLMEKLKKVIDKIDELYKNGNKVSLLGVSASGSLMINAFAVRKNKIHRVINNCGRVRPGGSLWLSYDRATSMSSSFRESIELADENITKFSIANCRRILTTRAIFDEVVPAKLTPIKGATNIILPFIEHAATIYLGITLFKKPLINFLLR